MPHVFKLGQRMDFFVSSENISISVRFAHHGYLDIRDIRISGIFGYHGYSDIIDIRISWIFGYYKIRINDHNLN